MDVQRDYEISEEIKLREENLECKNSINSKFSEEHETVSDANSMKEKFNQETCQISEESIGSGTQNKNNSNHSHSADANELLMKSNSIDKKKVPVHNTTPGKPRSRQEKLEHEKLNRINFKVLNITKSKGVTSHAKVIKGNVSPKNKICPTKRSKKVHFQMNSQKPDGMKNSNKKEANSLGMQLSTQNIVNSSAVIPIVHESHANIDKHSKNMLDYGFRHLKEEIKTLIQQCVEKEDTIESLEKRLKEMEKSYSDTKKKSLNLEQKNEKLSKNVEEATKKLDKAVQDLNSANGFISEAKQAKKIADNTASDLEKRLGQTLALNEKLKAKLDTMYLGGKNAQLSSQKRIEELTETNKLLSRQKSELREVVMKQMQLVNNLKRQLLHMKADVAQKFTEQEVMKVIDEFY